MTHHLMESIEDLDPFSPEQIELTRLMDKEKDGKKEFSRSLLGALSGIHAMMAMVTLAHFQRGAYEAHMRHRKTGDKADQMVATALWRTVVYMQEVRAEAEKSRARRSGMRLIGLTRN